MIVGQNYQFIHLHKCAGSTLAHLLMTHFGGARHGGIHNTENVNNQPIIGCIRNPFAWYVSLWAYGVDGKGQVYEEISRDDPDKISMFYTHPNDYTAFQKWLEYLIGNKECGLLTTRFKKLYFHNNQYIVNHMIRQEHLEDDFRKIMVGLGYESMLDSFTIPFKNVSFHDEIANYYSSEHKDLVLSKDNEIFSRFY